MTVSLQESTKNYLCHKIILNEQENFITWRSKQVKKKFKLLMTKLEKLSQETGSSLFLIVMSILKDSCAQKLLCCPAKEIIHNS